MKTYLVEEYSSDIEFDEDSTVVALTPKVCYQLDKVGVKYSIIEDYYDEVELSAGVDEYYESQLQWVSDLDEFLQNNVKELKELNLKLGTIYYHFLKTYLLDPLYIRCYTLNKLVEVIKPPSIVFVSRQSKETSVDFRLRSSGKSYYAQTIPIICNKRNIPLTSVFLEPNSIKEIKSVLSIRNLITWLGRTLYYRSATVRRLYINYQYFSKRPFRKPRNRAGLNIFILKLPHIRMDFVIDAIRNGHNVYQLSDNSILKYSSLGTRRCLHLKTEYKNNNIWENTARLLEGHDLIKRINQRCQLDVSAIVLPRLKYFVSQVCPEILGYFRVFTEFYKKERINFVITPHKTSPIEVAAIAAVNYQEHIKSVCIAHGNTVYNAEFWRIIELSHFNILISSNTEEKEYYSYLRQANNFPTKLYGSSHRLLDIKKIGCLRESNRSNIKKNRIVYLPTLMMWDFRRMDGASYPDAWYYEFQKSLIEYFSTRREYIFVWKGLPPSDAIYNPIPNFIRDNNFSNIAVATNFFPQHLLSADRVICDYPSTGFYESIIAGVPTMSLYHSALIVRKSAIDYFGNLLKPFSDATEATRHIDEFLNSDPEAYKMTLDVEDNHILDILEEAGRKVN